MSAPSPLVGYRTVTGHWRRHIATVRQDGPDAYTVRTFCHSMGFVVVNSGGSNIHPLDSAVVQDAVTHPFVCPRCWGSYWRRVGGGA